MIMPGCRHDIHFKYRALREDCNIPKALAKMMELTGKYLDEVVDGYARSVICTPHVRDDASGTFVLDFSSGQHPGNAYKMLVEASRRASSKMSKIYKRGLPVEVVICVPIPTFEEAREYIFGTEAR